jgi:TAP-like protein
VRPRGPGGSAGHSVATEAAGNPVFGAAVRDRFDLIGLDVAPASSCLDFPSTAPTYDAMAARELLGRVVAPRVRGASQTWAVQATCLGWPAPVVDPPRPLAAHGAPPILIVNATHDPATAYPWAHGLLDQIEGGVLLTRDGDGHTSYLSPGRTRDAIDAYLLTGAPPPPNSVYPD